MELDRATNPTCSVCNSNLGIKDPTHAEIDLRLNDASADVLRALYAARYLVIGGGAIPADWARVHHLVYGGRYGLLLSSLETKR